jgi:hypothetical protein
LLLKINSFQTRKLLTIDLSGTQDNAENGELLGQLPFSNFTPQRVKAYPNYHAHQKIRLIVPLIAIGAWDAALALLKRVGETDPACYEPVRRALCCFLHQALDPLTK